MNSTESKGVSHWNMPPTPTTNPNHRPNLPDSMWLPMSYNWSVPTHMFLDANTKESDVHALLIRLWNANLYRCLCRSLYADHSLAPFWCETMGMMNLILMTKSPKCISWVCLYSSFTLLPSLSHLLKCFGRWIFFWLPGATCWREFCANPELYESLFLKEYLPWN